MTNHPVIVRRLARSDDQSFLRELFATDRAPIFLAAGLASDMVAALIDSQYEAQRRSFGLHHPDAIDEIVELNGRSAGRLLVDRQPHRVHLVDIALKPEYRGCGVGTGLVQTVIDAADHPIELEVAVANPAVSLYSRLGFVPIDTQGMHIRMRRETRTEGNR